MVRLQVGLEVLWPALEFSVGLVQRDQVVVSQVVAEVQEVVLVFNCCWIEFVIKNQFSDEVWHPWVVASSVDV